MNPRLTRVFLSACLLALALAGCNLSRVTETPPAPQPPAAHTPFDMPPVATMAAVPPTRNPAPQRILFLGDSITEGWEVETLYASAVNAGRRGDTSAQVLRRYQETFAGQPFDAAAVLVGVNDITGGVNDQALRDNLTALVGQLRAQNLRVLVGSLLPVGGGVYNATVGRRIQETNVWLRELAASQGLTYVDYYSLMADGSGRALDPYFQDGLHPTRLGYAAMGDALALALR